MRRAGPGAVWILRAEVSQKGTHSFKTSSRSWMFIWRFLRVWNGVGRFWVLTSTVFLALSPSGAQDSIGSSARGSSGISAVPQDLSAGVRQINAFGIFWALGV